MKNILTIDCEDWYHTLISQKYLNQKETNYYRQNIYNNILLLLEILQSKNARATFFILGCVAEEYPKLILEIKKAGHRIGSHGYSHKSVFLQSKTEFEKEIIKVTNILREIISQPIESFRAPNWSINHRSLWAIEILKKYGYKYDSSLTYTMITSNNSISQNIIEIPRAHIKFLKFNIPFGGGAFLRLYPLKLTTYLMSKINDRGLPFMMYIHPWEIDNDFPLLKMSTFDKIFQYGNIASNHMKIKEILGQFKFVSIEEFFEQGNKEKILLNKFHYLI